MQAYRIYVTDALKLVVEHTATKGSHIMSARYYDAISKKPVDTTQTKEEIVASIRGKLANGGE